MKALSKQPGSTVEVPTQPSRAKLRHIMNSVFTLEMTKGHLKWSVADLARQSNVSRPLIYYHFGRGKRLILEKCLNDLSEEFYGLNKRSETGSLSLEGFVDALDTTRKWLGEYPAVTLFYLKFRSSGHPFASKFTAIEKRFQKKLNETFPSLSTTEIQALHGLIHGMVTIPFATRETIRASVNALWNLNS